jgi:hypothetical protein
LEPFILIFMHAAGWARNVLGICVTLLLGHIIFRSRAAAVVVTTVVMMLVWISPGVNLPVEIAYRAATALIVVTVIIRAGVFAGSVALFVATLTVTASTTLDPSRWLFASSVIVIAMLLLIGAFGFFRSLGARPLFSGAVLDE